MSRLTDAILKDKAYARNQKAPMLDLTNGGQHGFAPDLTEWVSNQNYVRRNLFCLLLEAPGFFKYLPETNKWTETLRALVELHPLTIEGLNAGLTVDTVDAPVGGAGEVQEEYIDVKRARSQPVFTYNEKYGRPIQTFLLNWISLGMMDPDTKVAGVGTLSGARPEDLLADMYSMTCIFIEPDPTHRKVVKSWLTTNMFPKLTGDIIGKRELAAGSELLSLSIEFTGLSQHNIGSDTLAQTLLDNINISNANPMYRKAFVDGISAEVDTGSKGYVSEVEQLSGEAAPFL